MPKTFNNNDKQIFYDIDYTLLYRELTAKPLFTNSKLTAWFIKKWILILKTHDCTNNYYNKLISYENHTNKNFYQPILYNTNQAYINFNIQAFDNITKDSSKITKKEIMLEEFDKINGHIYWSMSDFDLTSLFSAILGGTCDDYPVYIVPLITPTEMSTKIDALVIDGNHRINRAIEHKETAIPGLIFDKDYISDNKLFTSSFDMVFYIFYNEFNLFKQKKSQGIEDSILIMQSYLTKSGYEYNNI